MRLTQLTDYSFRVLMFLAVEHGRLSTIREIAARYGVSRNHLMKVANLLVRHGYVRAVRGRGGGLALARAPAQISLGEVARRLEDDFALVECMGPRAGVCRIETGCLLRGVMDRALEAFLQELDRRTLADIVGEPQVLHRLLDIPARARRA